MTPLGWIIYGGGMVWGGAPETVRREEILADLVERPVVLLGAPGGSGKTTTAEQLLATWEMDTVRVRFTAPTGLAQAASDLARAVRRAGLGDIAEAMRQERDNGAGSTLDAFAASVNERRITLAVFLDDVQHLDDEATARLTDALIDVSGRCRVIVAGRSLGGFAHLDRIGEGAHVGADRLRMSDAEIRALLGSDATDTLVNEVLEATTGWCAAVGLAAQRLRADPSWAPRGAGGRALLEELVAEMLHEAPRFAALVDVPLIDRRVGEIIGDPTLFDSGRVAGLLASHYGNWWVVPDPIREAIAEPTALDDTTLMAVAAHYRAHGELHAATTLLGHGTPSAMVDFLRTLHWTELENLGVHEVLAIVDRLDEQATRRAPELLLHVVFAIELSAPDRRAGLIARVKEVAAQRPDLVRAADAESARDLCSAARLDEAVQLAQRVLSECEPDEGVTRARSLSTLARVSVFRCTAESMAEGAVLYAEAARLFRDAGETRWLSETLARRGYTALYMGGAPHAGEAEMRAALALLPTGDYSRSFWLTNYSDVLDYLGRVPEAEAAAHEALEIGRRRRDPSIEGMAWWSLSWIAAHRCDLNAFRGAIREFERTAGTWIRPGQLVEFLSSTAELFAELRDFAACEEYIARARRAPASAEYPVPIDLAEARLLALQGDPDEAAALLEHLDSGMALVPSNRPTRVILHALAEARRANIEAAVELRAEAQRTAEAMGVPDLLARYAGLTLRTLDELTATSTADGSSAPGESAIHLRILGGFSVERSGESRTPQPGHPATLVKLLALSGLMTVDSAIDALWPDADVDTGRARLRNLLNRLKQRSGEIVVRDGETLRLHASVSCDLDLFEHRSAAALSATAEERVGLARSALSLYTGELLPGDVFDDWTLGPRERAKRRFLALADVVADDAIARGDSDEALRLLDLAIGAEPLDEARYTRMCEVLVQQGRLGTAREVAARAIAALDEIGEVADPRLLTLARG